MSFAGAPLFRTECTQHEVELSILQLGQRQSMKRMVHGQTCPYGMHAL